SGLSVALTYGGSANAPVNAGSYGVTGTINDGNYVGQASGTLTINKASATVTLGSLTQTYDGTPKAASAMTTPSGLSVALTYGGSANAPVNAGTYGVTGTINDGNYAGQASGTLTINKASATVTLGSLTQTYDGTPKAASATTTPPGLSVALTYGSSATAPVNAGTYGVTGTINDVNYTGQASGTLTI